MAEQAAERYPLAWPIGTPRTSGFNRTNGQFRSMGGKVGIPSAIKRLESEIDRMGGTDPLLSSNLRVRMSGDVVANAGEPGDPGVALYFKFKGKARVFACDRYYRVADNIAALAAHIDALRRIERYGVGTLEQALEGYRSLPADSAANWRVVFGLGAGATWAEVDAKFKERAKTAHPDKGGTEAEFAHISRARDFARQELQS